MNNSWNKLIYKCWAPIYDRIFNAGPFLQARKRVFEKIDFQDGANVLFVGVGTGADLEHLPIERLCITAIDYSEDMLRKAREKFPNASIDFLQMDAQNLHFPSEEFDFVVGSLILSVVPDSKKAFAEITRVCRKDGTVLIFDKFADPERGLDFGKKLLRQMIKWVGTDIGVSFEQVHEPFIDEVEKISDDGVLFGDMYRKIILKKNEQRGA